MPPVKSPVPKFLSSLRNILDITSYYATIAWSKDGKSFSIRKPDAFGRHICPRFYKHSNTGSFIRQLNMYGFRKINPHTDETGRKNISLEFAHDHFCKNVVDYDKIVRKPPKSRQTERSQTETNHTEGLPPRKRKYYSDDSDNEFDIEARIKEVSKKHCDELEIIKADIEARVEARLRREFDDDLKKKYARYKRDFKRRTLDGLEDRIRKQIRKEFIKTIPVITCDDVDYNRDDSVDDSIDDSVYDSVDDQNCMDSCTESVSYPVIIPEVSDESFVADTMDRLS